MTLLESPPLPPTVHDNLKLVALVLRKKFGVRQSDQDYEDLHQSGVIGLMRAVAKFEPERNCKFSPYAYMWIAEMIREARRTSRHGIRMPRNVLDKYRKFKKHFGESDPLPGPNEVIAKMGVTQETAERILAVAHLMRTERGIVDGNVARRATKEDQTDYEVPMKKIRDALRYLDPLKQMAFKLTYIEGLEPQEVNRRMGLSGARVRILRGEAMGEIRRGLSPSVRQA